MAQGTEPHRAQWKSQWGFLMAAVGSAVGLGNIWRFSYLCYENGGGAFLLPYLIALVTTGIPLLILEFGLGHRMRGSAPLALAKIHRRWEWLGWWMVTFVMFGIVLYYAVIIAWCVCYLWFSLGLTWGADPNTFFFQDFLGTTSGPEVLGGIRTPILLGLIVVWVINWVVVFFGVQRGIERANKVFMPLLFGLILILVAWTATLPGALEGLGRYLRPDFSRLSDLGVWIDAYGQTFFSLSLGFGIMIAYASYLPRKADITRSACLTGALDAFVAFIAGLAVFGTLGYMTSQTGKPFEDVVQHGIGLAFVAYPQAISLLPKFQQVFGVLFFLSLVVAGISSSVSIMEAFTASLIDKFRYPRKAVVTGLALVGFLGGLLFATGGGLAWLDIVDHFLSNYGLVAACLLQCVVVAWIFRASRLQDHVNATSFIRVGRLFNVVIRYLIPVVLLILLWNVFGQDLREPYGGYPRMALMAIGWGWLLFTFIVALCIATRKWRRPLT